MIEARRLCPQGIFLAGSHHKYEVVSQEIRRILAEFSPLVEPLSLDEAFIDVSGMDWLYSNPLEMAREIKARIKAELFLVASAGVATNKFLAKMASDWGKPDGLILIEAGHETEFLHNLPVSRLWGVGEKTARCLQAIGINTIGQLSVADQFILEKHFGRSADEIRRLTVGCDDRQVIPLQPAKSIGNEVTFEQDLRTLEDLLTCILELSQKVGRRLRKVGCAGRTVTVKVRFASFKTITRSRTVAEPVSDDQTIYDTARLILSDLKLSEGVRLLGVTISGLQSGGEQIALFSELQARNSKVSVAVDQLKDKFGEKIVTRGRLLKPSRPSAED